MSNDTDFEHIRDDQHLQTFCKAIADEPLIGFDTEFVSENRYRPELCLLQVAAGKHLAIIDTLSVKDLNPFWRLLTDENRVSIAHAAREEFLFCFRDLGEHPSNLFDLQIAVAMIGGEYPASYGNLVNRYCGIQLGKGETRTDWSRRPLSDRQIQYALQDVLHLETIHNQINEKLCELGRDAWLRDETTTWLNHLEKMETEPQWRRVSGISSLNRRALAVVREVFMWREQEAKRKNKSPKRIIPDDLMVEIAKKGTSDIDRLKSIRGIDRRISKTSFQPIADAVNAANAIDEDLLPRRTPRHKTQNLGLLGQFVATTLNLVCRDATIAHNLVGTASDVRELAAWKLGLLKHQETPPKLLTGWRKQFVAEWLDDVMDGKVSIRVGNPKSDQPLILTRDKS